MSKNNNYEISDSLWGRVVQYASSVKESWDKDVDEFGKLPSPINYAKIKPK